MRENVKHKLIKLFENKEKIQTRQSLFILEAKSKLCNRKAESWTRKPRTSAQQKVLLRE